MIKRFRMVVVDRDGALKAAYLGDDAAKADKTFETESGNKANEAVRLFVYPSALKTRQPAGELAQAQVGIKAQRVGLETEIEAATSALKTAKSKADAAEADADKHKKAIEAVEEQAAKSRKGDILPLHSPESLKMLRQQGETFIKRLADRQTQLAAAGKRLEKAQASLKAFDEANDPKKAK